MFRTRSLACVVAVLAALTSVTLLTSGRARATGTCTDTYTGANNGSWASAGNWSTGSVPGSSDVACIPAGVTVVVDETGDQAASIGTTSGTAGSLDVQGGQLTLGSGTESSALTNLTITGSGTLTGPASGSQALTVTGSTDISSASNSSTTFGPGLALTQTGTGTLTLGGGQDEEIHGSIDDQSTGSVSIDPSAYFYTKFTSAQPVAMAAGDYKSSLGSITAPSISIAGAVTLDTQLELTSGTTTLGAMLTVDQPLTLDAAATLDTGSSGDGIDFAGSTSTLNGTVSGSGIFETTSNYCNVALNGAYTVPTLLLNGGTVTDAVPTTSSISLTSLTVNSGAQLKMAAGDTITDSGPMTIDTGNIVGPGSGTAPSVTVAGNVEFTSESGTGTSSIVGVNVTQNGSGTFAMGGGTNPEEEYVGNAQIQINTTDTAAGAVFVGSTAYGNTGPGGITSVQPITLGGGQYENGGTLLTLEAPGFVVNGPVYGDPIIGNQELLLDGSGQSSLTGTLTIGYSNLNIPAGDEFTTGTSSDKLLIDGGSATVAGTLDGSGTFEETDFGMARIESGATFSVPTIDLESGSSHASPSTLYDETSLISPTSLVNDNSHLNIGAGDTIHDSGPYTQTDGSLAEAPSFGTGTLDVGGALTVNSVNGIGEATLGSGANDAVNVDQTGGGAFSIGGSGAEGEVLYPGVDLTTSTTASVTIDDSTAIDTGATIESDSSPITLDPTGPSSSYSGSGTIQAPGFILSGTDTNLGTNQLVQTGGLTDITNGEDLSAGSIGIAAGTVQLDGTIGAEAATPLTLTGGTLDGTGTVTGNVTNTSGTVTGGDAPGTLTIDGNYAQGSSGLLAVPITGTGSGNHSVIAVNGSATLAGTVQAQPTSGYASGAAQGDTFGALTYTGSLTGSFTSVLSQPALRDGEPLTESNDSSGKVVNLVVGAPQPPMNISAPEITGTPMPGDTLTCNPGAWTESPTFSFQWDSNGSAIPGATGGDYVVPASQVGMTLTCVVTASVGSQSVQDISAGVLVQAAPQPAPPPAPAPPQNTSPPTITGTALPGDTLTCSPGAWTESPSFSFQWNSNGSAIAGASADVLPVAIADEGTTLSCAVTATVGTDHVQGDAAGVLVAITGTLTCPQPTGAIAGMTLGAWHLGMTKTQARKVSKFFTVTKFGFDRFCMYGGWGVRTGYASSLLVAKLPKRRAKSLLGRVVMILAANTHYEVDGIRPGTALSAIPHTVKLSKPFKIGLNTWYLIRDARTSVVLKVADGVAQEVGIATKQLTTGSISSQRAFLSTFRQG